MTASTRPLSRSRLWFVVSVPVLAWAIHSALGVFVVVQACRAGQQAAGRWIVIAITLAALALCMATTALAYRSLRKLTAKRGLLDAEGRDQDEMLALTGVMTGVAFSLGIAWNGLPAVLLREMCQVLR